MGVEKRAQELRDRVGTLMIAIVDNVTSAPDDIKAVTKAAENIKGDVQDLIKQVLSLDL